jgi:hypothetical protein
LINGNQLYQFCFHSVGQGLFYTGKIEDFKFIYDCGSKPVKPVIGAVNNFLKNNSWAKSKIDALIISHLDYDHVSGIEYLLKKTSVRCVIMPYVSNIERILLILKNTRAPGWYISFVTDPVSYLIENFVETEKADQIILVVPEDEENGFIGPFNDGDLTGKNEFFDIERQVEYIERIEEETEIKQKWRKYLDNRKIIFRTHKGDIFPVIKWKFRFFVNEVEETRLQKFKKCIDELMKSNKLVDILREKSLRDKLKNEYKNLTSNLNITSLVLYHGPIDSHRVIGPIGICCHRNFCKIRMYGENYCHDLINCDLSFCCNRIKSCLHYIPFLQINTARGQLLTGDIDLMNNYNKFYEHMKNELSNTGLCLIPHHGSKKSWNSKILEDAKNCLLWVSSAGIYNRYGHPCVQVINDIVYKNEKYFYSVNELKGLFLTYQKKSN